MGVAGCSVGVRSTTGRAGLNLGHEGGGSTSATALAAAAAAAAGLLCGVVEDEAILDDLAGLGFGILGG